MARETRVRRIRHRGRRVRVRVVRVNGRIVRRRSDDDLTRPEGDRFPTVRAVHFDWCPFFDDVIRVSLSCEMYQHPLSLDVVTTLIPLEL